MTNTLFSPSFHTLCFSGYSSNIPPLPFPFSSSRVMRTVGGVGLRAREKLQTSKVFFSSWTHPSRSNRPFPGRQWMAAAAEGKDSCCSCWSSYLSTPLFTLLVESAHFEQAVYGVRGWVGAIKGVTLPPSTPSFFTGKVDPSPHSRLSPDKLFDSLSPPPLFPSLSHPNSLSRSHFQSWLFSHSRSVRRLFLHQMSRSLVY